MNKHHNIFMGNTCFLECRDPLWNFQGMSWCLCYSNLHKWNKNSIRMGFTEEKQWQDILRLFGTEPWGWIARQVLRAFHERQIVSGTWQVTLDGLQVRELMKLCHDKVLDVEQLKSIRCSQELEMGWWFNNEINQLC